MSTNYFDVPTDENDRAETFFGSRRKIPNPQVIPYIRHLTLFFMGKGGIHEQKHETLSLHWESNTNGILE